MASSLDHFKITGETRAAWNGSASAWAPGTSGTVTSLPAGFTHRFAVFSPVSHAGLLQLYTTTCYFAASPRSHAVLL